MLMTVLTTSEAAALKNHMCKHKHVNCDRRFMHWLDTIGMSAEYCSNSQLCCNKIISYVNFKALEQLLVFGDKLSMFTSAED